MRTAIICSIVACGPALFAQEVIKDYQLYAGSMESGGKQLLLLRRMEKSGQTTFLAVDPQTLDTKLVSASSGTAKPISWKDMGLRFSQTPYFMALSAAGKQSLALQDAGLTHGFPKERGVTLTVDLCPSHKPLDRVIFTDLITAYQQIQQPVPIALSITGRWMLTHTDDLNWLKELERKKAIEITWVDHSYNHHFSLSAPLKTNFLLEPGTDMNFEILGTELAMLQHNMVPSVFFRFPGLVSDQQVVDKVLTYGIIPIGSDAWLAKGQQPTAGSIVLIHGNRNEPVGVADFIRLLKTESAAITGKQWMMYDLSGAIEDEFSGRDIKKGMQ